MVYSSPAMKGRPTNSRSSVASVRSALLHLGALESLVGKIGRAFGEPSEDGVRFGQCATVAELDRGHRTGGTDTQERWCSAFSLEDADGHRTIRGAEVMKQLAYFPGIL